MKSILIVVTSLLFFTRCKKTYSCHCYSERRGFIFKEQTYTYKEKHKNDAFVKCTKEFESYADFMGGYCEIK